MFARRSLMSVCLAAAAVSLPHAVALAQDPATTAPAAVAPVNAAPVSPQNAAARTQEMIDKGLAYLASAQQSDGAWHTEKMPPAITAIALRCFLQDPAQAHSEPANKGLAKLLSYQMQDGGIYKDLLANYNTAIAVSTLAKSDDPAAKAALPKAVAYLKALQWTPETRPEYVNEKEANTGKQVVKGEDDPFYGGWGYGGRGRGPGRPDLSNSQLTLDALHDAGVKSDDPAMQAALKFVSRQQNFSETNSAPWAADDGGFVYGPAADGSGESFGGTVTDADGTRRLRSYGSMSYAGLKSMIYAGLTKQDPRVKAAFGWVTNNWTVGEHPGVAGEGPDGRQWGYNYYVHTLARALNAYDEPTLMIDGKPVDWRLALVNELATRQQPDGCFTGQNKWMENNTMLTTSYIVLALQEVKKDLAEHPADAAAGMGE